MNQQLKEAINMLNQAYTKFDLVSSLEAQDAIWHEIQSLKHKIDVIRKQELTERVDCP